MKNEALKKVLTIAGSDPSGGAGIQADIKTMTVHGKYAMSVITALTAQNTTGVYGIQEVSPKFAAQQMDCVFGDIVPDAVKTGMLPSPEIIEITAEKLTEYNARNIVVDPVMSATGGGSLTRGDITKAMLSYLFPIASIVTPNIPEAEALSGASAGSGSDNEMEKIVRRLAGFIDCTYNPDNIKPAILLKGGHLTDRSDDLLYLPEEDRCVWFRSSVVYNPNTHGTGCTLSSAIACNLADGMPVAESVRKAKEYVRGAISAGLDLGHGRGPLNHMFTDKR